METPARRSRVMDADCSIHGAASQLVASIEAGHDLAIGSRYIAVGAWRLESD